MLTVIPALVLALSISAPEDSVLGSWVAIDDIDGRERSTVQLYLDDGRLCGRITELIVRPGENPNPTCDKCPGDQKGHPAVGLVIIEGLTHDGTRWSGGTVLRPETGKLYDCTLWVEGDTLFVRGHFLCFYKTQKWVRGQQEE